MQKSVEFYSTEKQKQDLIERLKAKNFELIRNNLNFDDVQCWYNVGNDETVILRCKGVN